MKLSSNDGVIVVKLPGFGSGGYLWSVESVDSQLQIKTYNEAFGPPDAIGSSPTFCCEVKCDKPNIYQTVFSLKRPWEKQAIRFETVELEFRSQ